MLSSIRNVSFGSNSQSTTSSVKNLAVAASALRNDIFGDDDKLTTGQIATGGTIGVTSAAALRISSGAKNLNKVARAGQSLVGEATERAVKNVSGLEKMLAASADHLGKTKFLGPIGKILKSKTLLNVLKPIAGAGAVVLVVMQMLTTVNVAKGLENSLQKQQ